MMKGVARVDGRGANATDGRIVWSPAKSMWNSGTLLATLILGPMTFSGNAFLLFATTTYLTLLVGHSVGMHRRFIHRSYECKKWLERVLIYIGVLAGMAGPFGILKIHDHRDWAQRQSACHDFFAHRRNPLVDLFWQLNCRFQFDSPPAFQVEAEFANDPWYRFLEKTWMLQQLPVALVFYYFGGLSWVVWGVCARVSVSVIGHWSITYWCHGEGRGSWRVNGAAVQASNVSGLGVLTYGECWHNNHHAFPESAQIGLEPNQTDPGWLILKIFRKLGWAWKLGQPRPAFLREDITFVGSLTVESEV